MCWTWPYFSCALESRFSVVEGLDRHAGEQAPGRVDVPGKDIQQQAAAAKKKSLLFVSSSSHRVGRLVSSRWNTAPLSHGSGSTLHSGLGSVRMFSTWSGKAGCLGRETRWKVSGCAGHATAHVFLSLQQTAGDSWAMGMPVLWHGWVLADAAKLLSVRCAAARREWWPEASKGVSLPWTAKQAGVAHQPYEKVLRASKEATVSLLRMWPTGPAPASNNGLADPPPAFAVSWAARGGHGSCSCSGRSSKISQASGQDCRA